MSVKDNVNQQLMEELQQYSDELDSQLNAVLMQMTSLIAAMENMNMNVDKAIVQLRDKWLPALLVI